MIAIPWQHALVYLALAFLFGVSAGAWLASDVVERHHRKSSHTKPVDR